MGARGSPRIDAPDRAILQTDRRSRRPPETILRAIEVAERFDARAPLADHWAALAGSRKALDPDREDLPDAPDFSASYGRNWVMG